MGAFIDRIGPFLSPQSGRPYVCDFKITKKLTKVFHDCPTRAVPPHRMCTPTGSLGSAAPPDGFCNCSLRRSGRSGAAGTLIGYAAGPSPAPPAPSSRSSRCRPPRSPRCSPPPRSPTAVAQHGGSGSVERARGSRFETLRGAPAGRGRVNKARTH